MAKQSLGSLKTYDQILVDAMNVAAINFHAKRVLSYRGKPTGMLFGTIQLVQSLQKKFPGAHIKFLWEGRKSKRKTILKSYKEGRLKANDEFSACLRDTQNALLYMGISQECHPELEADDVAGWYAKRAKSALLVSNDSDWWAFLVSGKVDVLIKNIVCTYEDIKEELGFLPERLPLWNTIKGSHNGVPGIPRFPSKIAFQVVQNCATVDESIEFVNRVNAKWGKVMEDSRILLYRNASLIFYHDSWVKHTAFEHTPAEKSRRDFRELLLSRGIKSLVKGL